ncbi:MAG: hypothetical protein QQN53_08170 [Nitrosopumilus sp.]
MSDKPSAAWYLAPIFLGIIGSAIMWYVLKDEDHPDSLFKSTLQGSDLCSSCSIVIQYHKKLINPIL